MPNGRLSFRLGAILGALFIAGCEGCTPPIKYGWVSPVIRDSVIANLWQEVPPYQEKAFCITEWKVREHKGRTDYDVLKVDTLVRQHRTSQGVRFFCGLGIPWGHLHTWYTCHNYDKGETCYPGGIEAYQCQPSRVDRLFLRLSQAPFGIVVCGPKQWTFFYPSEAPPP